MIIRVLNIALVWCALVLLCWAAVAFVQWDIHWVGSLSEWRAWDRGFLLYMLMALTFLTRVIFLWREVK